MVDWQALMEGRVDGSSLSVGGTRVSEPVRAIPSKDITTVLPETPQVRRNRAHKEAPSTGNDKSTGTVTPESPLDELHKYGGYIHLHEGKVACQVADGRIRKMWVRGPFLSGLPFTAEADIERLLGPAAGLERSYGSVIFHYPERSLSVSWYARENRLESVALGTVDWSPLFGARRVLEEWLAAAHAGLDPHWEEPTDHATSEWVRYARVVALLRALELGSPRDFAAGKFLMGKPMSAYPLAEQVLREVQKMSGLPDSDEERLSRLFWWLLIYRMQAEKLLQINSGWLVAGMLGIYTALRVTGDANEAVKSALQEIEVLLVELIDSMGRQVTERELIERWGWPQVDLDELLADET
jgi:hypothetical protein